MASSQNENIVVVGTGYWGPNHVRVLSSLGAIAGVVETEPARLNEIKAKFPIPHLYSSHAEAFQESDVYGVIVSSPASTHYEIAKEAISAGKDVLVEKPLALKVEHARELIELAKKKKRVLMVGHLLQYHPAMLKLKEMVSAGELGTMEYLYSNRLNLGKIRREENALWSFAPHDISIMLWLIGSMPIQVNAVGGSYLQPNVADTTISSFVFDNGVRAHIYVSWLHPFKEQRLVVVGSKKMAVFDDRAAKERKLLLYDKNVKLVDGNFVAEKPEGVPVVYDYDVEPLRAECEHFLHCMKTRETPRTDGEEGLRVLKVLQSCERSLQMNGQPVQVLE